MHKMNTGTNKGQISLPGNEIKYVLFCTNQPDSSIEVNL